MKTSRPLLPEPGGKLGAVTASGPEGVLEWDAIDWRAREQDVRRLRRRIFKAAREGDWPKVRNLQKLMLRSRANTLVSVRQVTQRNAGRKTAGIGGEVAPTPEARAQVAVRVHQSIGSWHPRAVRRVHIPKATDRAKLRPLGGSADCGAVCPPSGDARRSSAQMCDSPKRGSQADAGVARLSRCARPARR